MKITMAFLMKRPQPHLGLHSAAISEKFLLFLNQAVGKECDTCK